MGNTVADGLNGILRDTAIAVSLKYLGKISLINCKVELKLKSPKYCLSCGWW